MEKSENFGEISEKVGEISEFIGKNRTNEISVHFSFRGSPEKTIFRRNIGRKKRNFCPWPHQWFVQNLTLEPLPILNFQFSLIQLASLAISVRYCTFIFLFLLFHLCIVGPTSMYIYISPICNIVSF